MSITEAKCVIWDLDDTIWDGILAENDTVTLKPGIAEILSTLDFRGILNSIASKNNFDDAMQRLKDFGVDHYFLCPEINWNAKSSSVQNIQQKLNIGMDTILFIDDQIFEREEVVNSHPLVECVDALDYSGLTTMARLNPKVITEDSPRRRGMYQDDMKRDVEERNFQGPKEGFLDSLGLHFKISSAGAEDMKRAEELTRRTSQLNASGVIFSYDELDHFRTSPDHELLVCELTDKYGSYGKIGLALIEKGESHWHLRLLLMSCRVISRGVGTVLLTHIMQEAKNAEKELLADFRRTDRNKMMYIMYKFANFKERSKNSTGHLVLENRLEEIPKLPWYIKLEIQNQPYGTKRKNQVIH